MNTKRKISSRIHKYIRALTIISCFTTFFLATIILSIYLLAKLAGPPSLAVPETTFFYDDSNKLLETDYHNEKRHWIPLEKMAPAIIDATISIEDRRFETHHGFDFHRIVGALIADIKAMGKVQGASTITQQYARNLYLDKEKTWKRKWMEAVYTVRLEANYAKEDILEGYLNTIYYGHGVYGIEAAANLYFQKQARDVTLEEAALLAAIPKGPSYYSPFLDPIKAKERRDLVLQAMHDNKLLSEEALKMAIQIPLQLATPQHEKEKSMVAPYFQDAMKQELQTKTGIDAETIKKGGLHIYTTINTPLQQLAEKQLHTSIPHTSKLEASFLAMDAQSGEVKALIGGRSYEKSPFNRAMQAVRQPGSTFKPLLYYAALENGYTSATKLKSEPTTFKEESSPDAYTPHNINNVYGNRFITLAEALALSDNIYAVKTHLSLGKETLVETAKRFGIHSPLDAVPSLALGTSPVTLADMTSAYGMIANGGKHISPFFIKRVIDQAGNVLYDAHIEQENELDKSVTFILSQLMTGMFDHRLNSYHPVTGHAISSKLTRQYAGKSGTTNTDSWMIGFTPTLVSGVWIGYDEGRKLETKQEQQLAKNIWATFMEEGLKHTERSTFEQPANVVSLSVDPHSGLLATEACPAAKPMYFVKGTEPTEHCTTQKQQEETPSQEKWYRRWLPF
ncbi:transglycosylase domain-containing protein [Priestia taiwanensis]|uniref:Penicillin-binding protein n=1 Tax=Priestia taiwanensis TaxID=1347902 RepID=A0A917AY21_9BACI|nr:PBP1A family penicillin-binding protein [Priestia taiwanensis]MBM7364945.1 1A family penicillin-binding protein [Priestia taiwanensis]GGE82313.1 penicillin-binding protein [Priestia taiwanensis]